ncbi:MAG: FliM/FliN family flagellar motor switch protein, partial [Desulfamplus sp.]
EIEQTDLAWKKMLESVILESIIELRIELGATEITGERLWLMQEGDIIQLDHDATDMLTGYVGDLPKIKGYAGVRRGFQAFRVEEKLKLK